MPDRYVARCICLLSVFVLFACASSGKTSNPSISTGNPNASADTSNQKFPPLASHVMAFHDSLRLVVMFGGADPDRRPSNALWGWNGIMWQILFRDGPGPRQHTGMAYDRKRNRLVIYGGIKNREESFADTWEWDGQTWQQRAVGEESPGIRDHHYHVNIGVTDFGLGIVTALFFALLTICSQAFRAARANTAKALRYE